MHDSVWPNGCHDPDSCIRHGECMYFGCEHKGSVLVTAKIPKNAKMGKAKVKAATAIGEKDRVRA